MLALTQVLTRTRSFQVLPESTTLRGNGLVPSHSCAFSVQNSIQPIGARVVSLTAANSGRSVASSAPEVATITTATEVARPNLNSAFVVTRMMTPPVREGPDFPQSFCVAAKSVQLF